MQQSAQASKYYLASPKHLLKLIHNKLWVKILVAMTLGVSIGLLLAPSGGALLDANTANTVASWLALPGRIFLALIQMIVVPLVVSSIVGGIASSGDTDFLRKVGLRIAPYFLITTTIAVSIGALLVLLIEPGSYINLDLNNAATNTHDMALSAGQNSTQIHASIPQKIVAVIPSNPSDVILQRAMFQIVILSIFLAVALITIPKEKAKPMLDLIASIQEISMKVVSWAMALAPIAVFGLLAEISIQIGLDALLGMSVYVATVLLGLLALVIVYLLIVKILAGYPAMKFLSQIRQVQLLAFSTSSSAAVMPLSIQTAEKKLQLNGSVARFIIPLGATVNMDGTALYQVIAGVFLTQLFGIDLSAGQLALLAVTTIGASIGAPSTPGVGIVILATIVQGLGVPPVGVALILGVDRILDMARTAVNVSGDLTACVVMDKWIGHDINDAKT